MAAVRGAARGSGRLRAATQLARRAGAPRAGYGLAGTRVAWIRAAVVALARRAASAMPVAHTTRWTQVPGAVPDPSGTRVARALRVWVTVLALLLAPALGVVGAAAGPAAALAGPTVATSPGAVRPGGVVTVTGAGWKPGTLLAILLCGQNAIGGTNSCANDAGRAATADAAGQFSRQLPVVAPPKPCPCVIHVSTVTGEQLTVDAPFTVAGHPTAPLPTQAGSGRIAVLTARLRGGGGVLTWFGAPARRTLVFTVGNLGSGPVKDPAFDVGTSHGVYAPQWDRQQWHGTVPAGGKQQVSFPVELGSGAHGAYTVRLRYGGQVLVTEPWAVGRPWGVTLFWILLFLVVPAALFRIGMLVVDRARPRVPSAAGGAPAGHRGGRAAWHPATVLAHLPGRAPKGAPPAAALSAAPRRGLLAQLPAPRRRFRPAPAAPPEPAATPAPDAADGAEAVGSLPWFTHGALPALRTPALHPPHDIPEPPPPEGSP